MTTTVSMFHVPRGTGHTTWMSGDVYRMMATHEETGGSLAVVEAVVPPGSGPVAHAHPRADEAFFILEGELEFLNQDRLFTAAAGDFVFVPRGTRHRFKNVSDTTARMIFLFTPAGPERLFVEGGDLPVAGSLPEPWPMERFAALADLAARTGTEIMPEAPPGT